MRFTLRGKSPDGNQNAAEESLGAEQVLREEREAILRARGETALPGDSSRPLTALCISGGGIRSATFGLGAIQSLARHGLLDKFDYLSTVSGGGYIGSWLTAWVTRAEAGGENVIRCLQGNATPNDGDIDPEIDPVQHLREYNNYLTPRLGEFSEDTWTLAATVLRNLALNWLVLIPLLLCFLMAPRILLSAAPWQSFTKTPQKTIRTLLSQAHTLRPGACRWLAACFTVLPCFTSFASCPAWAASTTRGPLSCEECSFRWWSLCCSIAPMTPSSSSRLSVKRTSISVHFLDLQR
jgi:hypothetical protein